MVQALQIVPERVEQEPPIQSQDLLSQEAVVVVEWELSVLVLEEQGEAELEDKMVLGQPL